MAGQFVGETLRRSGPSNSGVDVCWARFELMLQRRQLRIAVAAVKTSVLLLYITSGSKVPRLRST